MAKAAFWGSTTFEQLISTAVKQDFAERDKCSPVLPRLSSLEIWKNLYVPSFHHDGKISPGCEGGGGGGCTPTPFHHILPSRTKFQCALQLRMLIHSIRMYSNLCSLSCERYEDKRDSSTSASNEWVGVKNACITGLSKIDFVTYRVEKHWLSVLGISSYRICPTGVLTAKHVRHDET